MSIQPKPRSLNAVFKERGAFEKTHPRDLKHLAIHFLSEALRGSHGAFEPMCATLVAAQRLNKGKPVTLNLLLGAAMSEFPSPSIAFAGLRFMFHAGLFKLVDVKNHVYLLDETWLESCSSGRDALKIIESKSMADLEELFRECCSGDFGDFYAQRAINNPSATAKDVFYRSITEGKDPLDD